MNREAVLCAPRRAYVVTLREYWILLGGAWLARSRRPDGELAASVNRPEEPKANR